MKWSVQPHIRDVRSLTSPAALRVGPTQHHMLPAASKANNNYLKVGHFDSSMCSRCTDECSSCLQGPGTLPRRQILPLWSSRRLEQRWMLACMGPRPTMTAWMSWVGATTQVGGHQQTLHSQPEGCTQVLKAEGCSCLRAWQQQPCLLQS